MERSVAEGRAGHQLCGFICISDSLLFLPSGRPPPAACGSIWTTAKEMVDAGPAHPRAGGEAVPRAVAKPPRSKREERGMGGGRGRYPVRCPAASGQQME